MANFNFWDFVSEMNQNNNNNTNDNTTSDRRADRRAARREYREAARDWEDNPLAYMLGSNYNGRRGPPPGYSGFPFESPAPPGTNPQPPRPHSPPPPPPPGEGPAPPTDGHLPPHPPHPAHPAHPPHPPHPAHPPHPTHPPHPPHHSLPHRPRHDRHPGSGSDSHDEDTHHPHSGPGPRHGGRRGRCGSRDRDNWEGRGPHWGGGRHGPWEGGRHGPWEGGHGRHGRGGPRGGRPEWFETLGNNLGNIDFSNGPPEWLRNIPFANIAEFLQSQVFGGNAPGAFDAATATGDRNVTTTSGDHDFSPPVDVFDTEAAYVVHVSLAGAKKEDVSVNWDAEKGELVIAGVVYRPGDEELLKSLALDERKVGAFERKVKLGSVAKPAAIEVEGIAAKMEDGVLRVTMPKLKGEDFVEIHHVDVD